MDVRPAAIRPTWSARRDSTSGPTDGDRESELGLHAHSGGAEERGPSRARSTIASILKAEGIPPSRERPSSWRTFLRAHWSAVVAADFFTTEVWTARGLVTYYTLFVLELQSRRVHVAGSTPYPDEAFVLQAVRDLANAMMASW